MNKKRTDLLIAALKDLNPTHYLQVCRQLQFELGETFNDISDLQKDLSSAQKDVSVNSVKKINGSIGKSVLYFNEFLKSFHTNEDKFPEKFAEMYVRSALMAHFYLARLHSKIICAPNLKVKPFEIFEISIKKFQLLHTKEFWNCFVNPFPSLFL